MIKVYIASAYSLGDVAVNVKLQIDTADILMSKGFSPYVPLLAHFQHMAHPRPYNDWFDNGLEWLRLCDCLLRLEGESSGADKEVEEATKLGIRVFYSIDDLLWYYNSCVVSNK